MKEKYYPVDFEAQYEQTSEKMIQISKKYKDLILNSNPDSIDKIQQTLDGILMQIQEHDLLFRKESIYSQFAPGQLMAQRRKKPPQMCPECGQELKKTVQCQFCAQLFCKKCCSRSRVIPFVSKQSRTCCQQCHFKFVKLFDNKNFYEQKEKLVNVVTFARNKTNKLFEKINSKKQNVQLIKNEKRNERIKQKNMQKKIQEEQKKLKVIQQQFKNIVFNKATKIKQAQRIKKQQQQEQKRRRNVIPQQKIKRQEQQKIYRRQIQEIQINQNDQISKVQQLQKSNNGNSIPINDNFSENSEEKSFNDKRKLINIRQNLQKQEKNIEEKQSNKSKSSFRSNKKFESIQTPKHVLFQQKNQTHQINTATTTQKKRSRKQSQDMSINSKKIDTIVSTDLVMNATQSIKKSDYEKQPSEKQSNNKLSEQPEDSLQRSLSRMLKLNKEDKDDQSKSIVSGISKTSKNVIDMTVNQLLGLRIPMAQRSSSKGKIAEQVQGKDENLQNDAISSSQNLTANEEGISPVSPLSSRERSSIKIENIKEPQIPKDELIRDRNQIILRNSTLISSTNSEAKTSQPVQYEPKKCECTIM